MKVADGHMEDWGRVNYNRFAEECESAGLEVYRYRGRFYYNGPAVNCDDIQDVIRVTGVKVQWDSMGRGYVVYPV